MFVRKTALLSVAAAVALGTPAPAAAAAAAKDRTTPGLAYAGETAQTTAVSLVLTKDRRKIKRLDITWLALPEQCTSGLPYVSMTTFGTGSTPALAISATKRFRHSFTDAVNLPGVLDLAEVPVIRGTVGRTRASGTFRATVVLRDGAGAEINRCDTGVIPWTAVQ